ncbi:MAG: beta-glucosidase [Ignavibacteriae bacterium HGW-Ignavibacteriae-2]|nr:MAG: beta-glucosidase [Ignavibacteriae bacterium HGW-Ignavibacteriae-2]
MKRIALLLMIILSSISVSAFTGSYQMNKNSRIIEADKFVNNILSKMSLEEKIGQMTQITLEVVSQPRPNEGDELFLDVEKLNEAILKYHVGSILNTGGSANSLEKWHEVITTIQDIATKETRLGIPVLYGIDAIHGATYTLGATLFPQAIAMAATRNRELVRKGAEITAFEMRASGIPWNFNPVLDMGREPLWSRLWETYGEDTYMTSEYAREYIKGIQGNDVSDKSSGVACLKHYMGYSLPKNGFDRTPAWIPERMLREIILPPFAAAIDEGALTVMINSGEINGIPTHSDYHILTEILKDELQFKGFAVSDWEDVKRLYTRDRVAASPKEAVKLAVMAGVDMSMVPYDFSFYEYLLELVKDGEVPMKRIDDAVSRILRVKYLAGLFDNAYPDKSLSEEFASQNHTSANLASAQEVITLLKNENNILPLKKDKKVFVTGPAANLLSVLNGGWTITWQGNNESLYPQEKFTILEAIQNKVGADNTQYLEGVNFDSEINVTEAVEKAKNSDVIVLCLGEPPYCETPGNISNLNLSEVQLQFAKKIYETGKPVVLVLVEGRPRVINEIVEKAEGILLAYLPGMEGGRAIADVLFGDVNPSGKLPYSYPIAVNGFTTYDYKPLENANENVVQHQWHFGYGLSYTSFEYSNLKLDKINYEMNDDVNISVDVKNTGQLAGQEVVELYICDKYGSVSRPVKQLRGFEKISLDPAQVKTISFKLTAEDLSFIGRENKRITESGEFSVMIENLEQKFVLK